MIAWQPDVLVFGGSLGSTRINQAAAGWADEDPASGCCT